MATIKLSSIVLNRIDYILENFQEILGSDYVKKTQRKLEQFRQPVTEGLKQTDENNLKVAVVGAFSCGKSTFINSILGDEVAPVEITPKTHGVTSFIYGAEETYDADGASITRAEYQEQVQDGENQVKHFIVHYPCDRLQNLEFMDSPGFGSVSGKDEAVAKKDTALSEEAVNRADVVFFLTNITEGVIQGDALARLEAICNQKDSVVNPHRRIYVILTWADAKSPGERANVQQSIQKLCTEHQLPIENVLLYSSLPLEKFKSASSREYFTNARENLFRILLDLQKFRVELLSYRQKLQSQLGQVKVKSFMTSLQAECRQLLDGYRDIKAHDVQNVLRKDWEGFRDEVAEYIYKVLMSKFKDCENDLCWHEEGKLFSSSRIEMNRHVKLMFLSKNQLSVIVKGIEGAAQKFNLPYENKQSTLKAGFLNDKSVAKSSSSLTDQESAYNIIEFWGSWDDKEIKNARDKGKIPVFPLNSLRDQFLKLCMEKVLSVGGPWREYEPDDDKLNDIKWHKIGILRRVFESEAKEDFSHIIDNDLKPILLGGKQEEMLQAVNAQIDDLKQILDNLETEKALPCDAVISLKQKEQSSNNIRYDIILTNTGKKIMAVAKVVVQETGKEMEEVLEELEELPFIIQSGLEQQQAERVKAQLEEVGAKAELKAIRGEENLDVVIPQYDVVLTETGRKVMSVAKLIVQLTGMKMESVLEALEELPFTIKSGLEQKQAEEIKVQLEEVGATIELQTFLQGTTTDATISKYDVVLTETGRKVMSVAKLVMKLTGKKMGSVLESWDGLPFIVLSSVDRQQAEEAKTQLEEAGATVELKAIGQEALHDPVVKQYDVILTDTGRRVMSVAKWVVQLTGKEVESVLDALDELPLIVLSSVAQKQAEEVKERLEEVGATVELKTQVR